jgi:hypothetical protein
MQGTFCRFFAAEHPQDPSVSVQARGWALRAMLLARAHVKDPDPIACCGTIVYLPAVIFWVGSIYEAFLVVAQ